MGLSIGGTDVWNQVCEATGAGPRRWALVYGTKYLGPDVWDQVGCTWYEASGFWDSVRRIKIRTKCLSSKSGTRCVREDIAKN